MTAGDVDVQTANLEAEEASLRTRLRALEDEIHSNRPRSAHAHDDSVDEREKQIRRIVLRLVEIERERIEIRIFESL